MPSIRGPLVPLYRLPGGKNPLLRACLVKVKVGIVSYALSYEKPSSTAPILSRLVYERLREDGVEVESLDESYPTPHADLLEDV